MNSTRNLNRDRVIAAVKNHPKFNGQLEFIEATPNSQPAWFGLCCMIAHRLTAQMKKYLDHLTQNGVENRPIISGNFVRQPVIRNAYPDLSLADLPGAEIIGSRGFFVGLHVDPLSEQTIQLLADKLLSFEFKTKQVVLVTGGSGLVGSALQELIKKEVSKDEEEWIFIGRKDADLCNLGETKRLFEKYCPTHVIHLAVELAGSAKMAQYKVEMWQNNSSINANVLQCCKDFGVQKLVSVLSSMAYPAKAESPLKESFLHEGPPPPSVETYAMAKRVLDMMCRSYKQEFGCNFVNVIPPNIFGPNGAFRADGPLIEACIVKVLQTEKEKIPLTMFGTGEPVREFIYSKDLAHLLIWALRNYNDSEPINLPGQCLKVADLVSKVTSLMNFTHEVVWDTSKPDGPLSRVLDTQKLKNLYPSFAATPFDQALKETVHWCVSEHQRMTKM